MIHRIPRAVLVLASLAVLASSAGRAEETKPSAPAEASPAPDKAQQAADRALAFLVRDAAKWRNERGCATCHHGAMTVWALSEARNQGYQVSAETLADTTKWTRDLFVPQFSKPRDPRWGYNFVSLPGIYLAIMSETLPVLTRDEINRMAVHLARHQEEDGAYLEAPPNPNGSPPTFESRETMALLALLAWERRLPADSEEAAAARSAREKLVVWLEKEKPSQTTQSLLLRLLLDVRAGRTAEQLRPKIDQILAQQNPDGGWSQVKELPSDAYATGQLLWVLSFSGIEADHPAVGRAIAFLVVSQEESGAWPMTPRYHPRADASKKRNLMPITYFGAAWATLGLVRFVPPHLDAATRQQRTFDYLRTFSGAYTLDEGAAGKPLVGIRISYEIDDDQVRHLANLAAGLPQLASLRLKANKITDAGATRLKGLPQLRSLSLEEATITDAGLAALKTLTALEELNLKGTRVSDTAVEEFQRAVPKVKIER